ncbi:MAG: YkgJ family cysteine cluster protein [Sandaracinaceae bacterium]|nr:YkgJ family cysteine cluster protein [Sandaracinaceae bacterium]
MPPPEYAALREKVDAFTRETEARRHADLACRAGCAACCHVSLEVSDVEAAAVREAVLALDEAARARLAERASRDREEGGPCVMLEDERCVIYAARPPRLPHAGPRAPLPVGHAPARRGARHLRRR